MGRKLATATTDKRSSMVLASASNMEDHLALRAAVDSLSTNTHTPSPRRKVSPSRAPCANDSSRVSTRHSKRLGAQGIGGNGRQSSLDTWMSSHSADGKENRRAQSAPTKPGSSPCRSTPRRPRSDYEPLSLISVQTAPQTPQRSSTPKRASPRLRARKVYEVSCSEDEELETPASQTSRRPPQTHIISSDDNEADDGRLGISPRIRRRRRSAREVIKSSDDEECNELIHPYPVAKDLVPQSDKTPWSTVSGPEQDIVLATPKRDRVRHYTVLDSDHELSEEERDLPMFTSHRASVAARHLSLPVLDSEGEESDHALTKPRPLVLEHLSDEDSSEEPIMGTASMTATSALVDLEGHQPIPKLQASKDALASPSAAQLRKRKYIAALKRGGKDPFAEFEILLPQKRKSQAPVPDTSEIVDITADDDETLQESDASKVPPKLRKVSEHAPEVVPMILQRTETLESISSFSTASGSQQDVLRVDPTSERGTLQVDEIEYFSDDPRTQKTTTPSRTNEGVQAKRQTKLYSPLRLVNSSRPVTHPKATEHGHGVRGKEETRAVTNQVCAEKTKETEPEPSLVQDDQPRGPPTVTPPQTSTQKCPLCHKMIPADDLMAHVDEELRVKDQETNDARQKQDEALAVALTETYQTQDAMFSAFSQTAPQTQDPSQEEHATTVQTAMHQEDKVEATHPFVTPLKPKRARDIVSMDTPMRRIEEMVLHSPFSGSKPSKDFVSMDTPMRKIEGMTLNSPFSGPKPLKDSVSLDTPMRKIGGMTLNSPSSGSKSSRDIATTNTPAHNAKEGTHKSPLSGMSSAEKEVERNLSDSVARVKDGESLTVNDHESAPDHEEAYYLEADSLSSQNPLLMQSGQIIESTPPDSEFSLFLDPFSLSSQNPFMMQPGQIIDSSPPEPYFSTRPNARPKSMGKERSKERNNPANMEQASPQALIVSDDSVDDLDDFLDLPEPASMLHRSFRTKAMGKAKKGDSATPKMNKSPRKAPSRAGKGTGRKGTIALDDSDDEDGTGEEASVVKSAKGVPKAKSCILDRMLPLSARERRQSILKKRAARKSDHKAESEVEIEVGRHLTEKLWNANDDLFDSEGLDRRQVKGVGLGGVVGGIGAVSGSLAVSNITKSAMEAARAKEGSEMSSRQDWGADDERRGD
ncbi:hypothetical protein BGZ68_005117, partial [Mortierella alpina]